MVYSLGSTPQYGPGIGVAIKEKFVNNQVWFPKGLDKSRAVVNYFIGEQENWHSDIPTYDVVGLGKV